MRLLADENCRRTLVEALRAAGHDVLWISEVARGADDDEIIEASIREQRVVITQDKDFGELAIRADRPLPGIVLLRFAAGDDRTMTEKLLRLLTAFEKEIDGRLVVLTERGQRLRRLTKR